MRLYLKVQLICFQNQILLIITLKINLALSLLTFINRESKVLSTITQLIWVDY